MKDIWYPTEGTCSRFIHVQLSDDHVIEDIEFIGGCNGNLKGISSLVKGQRAASTHDHWKNNRPD